MKTKIESAGDEGRVRIERRGRGGDHAWQLLHSERLTTEAQRHREDEKFKGRCREEKGFNAEAQRRREEKEIRRLTQINADEDEERLMRRGLLGWVGRSVAGRRRVDGERNWRPLGSRRISEHRGHRSGRIYGIFFRRVEGVGRVR